MQSTTAVWSLTTRNLPRKVLVRSLSAARHLRLHIAGGSNPAQPVAVHAVRPRLALPAFLHHSLLAMLGAEFADRGMDGSQTQAAVPELSIKGRAPLNLSVPCGKRFVRLRHRTRPRRSRL